MSVTGRAGRLSPGKCYRLYTEQSYLKMQAATHPEILRTNLTSFVLTLMALGINNILKFDLMSTPTAEALSIALETLFALGAIIGEVNTDQDFNSEKRKKRECKSCQLTPLGLKMSQFPTEPRVSAMLMASLEMECSEEILSVAAVLQVRELFLMPRSEQQKMDYDATVADVIDRSGDHVTVVNVMEELAHADEEECRARFVNYLALKRAKEIRAQLSRFLRRFGKLKCAEELERSRIVRKCVSAGFFFNIARLGNDGRYYTIRGKHGIRISDRSILSQYGECSEFIVFGETYDGNRGGMEVRMCSSIEGKWLRELAPHYWG